MFDNLKNTGLAALAVALLFAAAPAQAVPSVVTSLADFNAAIGGAPTTTDPFDNDIPGGVSITFDSGVQSTLAGGDLSLASFDNRVFSGTFPGILDGDGSDAALTLTWDFPAPVIGIGFDATDVNILDIRVAGSGTFFDINTAMGGTAGFFGIVDTVAPFSSIEFSVQASIIGDVFNIDNLIFASPPVSAVPEPGTLAIVGLGLLGLAAARRQTRR